MSAIEFGIKGATRLSTDTTSRKPYLLIANQYLQKQDTASSTVEQLANFNTSYGILLAGEIALEAAWNENDPKWLDVASDLYDHCSAVSDTTDTGGFLDLTSANLRSAHMTTLRLLFEEHKLPDAETASSMYRQISVVGKLAVDHTAEKRSNISPQEYGDLSGKLGEIAVLLLAQRYALRSIGTDTWLPTLSTFGQDHGGNCVSTSHQPSWDVSITTELDNSFNDPFYKVQVKRSDAYVPAETYGSTVVCVYPHLALRAGETNSAETIIKYNFYEQDAQIIDKTRITQDLDDRTEKLLDVIDR